MHQPGHLSWDTGQEVAARGPGLSLVQNSAHTKQVTCWATCSVLPRGALPVLHLPLPVPIMCPCHCCHQIELLHRYRHSVLYPMVVLPSAINLEITREQLCCTHLPACPETAIAFSKQRPVLAHVFGAELLGTWCNGDGIHHKGRNLPTPPEVASERSSNR